VGQLNPPKGPRAADPKKGPSEPNSLTPRKAGVDKSLCEARPDKGQVGVKLDAATSAYSSYIQFVIFVILTLLLMQHPQITSPLTGSDSL
jgi:hypothetical protein